MAQHIQWRRGTAAEATSANPVLAEGEAGFETDTGLFKIGDGVTAWNALDYAGGGGDIAVPGGLDATGTPSSSTFLRGDGVWASPAGGGGGDLLAANNLSDLTNAGTARTNLGLGTAATTAAAAYATAAQGSTADTAASGLAAHLADTVDAHDASAVSFAPVGTIAGTDVQTAVAEVATDAATALSTHEADTTSVHGITNTASLYVAGGTDVAVADGGTGSSTAGGARTNLGLIIGTDVATAAQGTTADTAVQPARSISTTAPLTGGGDLSANRTFAVSTASATAVGVVELATDAETITGTDTTRATTPANVAAATIAKALVDAKGDLIVATAADTVTRLPVGTNTHVLTADSAEATGVKWAVAGGGGGSVATDAIFDAKGDLPVGTAADTAAKLTVGANGWSLVANSNATQGISYAKVHAGIYESGSFITPFISRGNATNTTPGTVGQMTASLVSVPRRLTVDQVKVTCNTLTVGENLRIGLYYDDGGTPGALVVDWSTISATTTGAKTITVSTVLDPGLYWLAWVPQVTNTARYYGADNNAWGTAYFSWDTGTGDSTKALIATATTTTGALPDPFGAISAGGSNLLQIGLRMA